MVIGNWLLVIGRSSLPPAASRAGSPGRSRGQGPRSVVVLFLSFSSSCACLPDRNAARLREDPSARRSLRQPILPMAPCLGSGLRGKHMNTITTADEVLAMAIDLERTGKEFYEALALGCGNRPIGQLCAQLARAETGHAAILEEMRRHLRQSGGARSHFGAAGRRGPRAGQGGGHSHAGRGPRRRPERAGGPGRRHGHRDGRGRHPLLPADAGGSAGRPGEPRSTDRAGRGIPHPRPAGLLT